MYGCSFLEASLKHVALGTPGVVKLQQRLIEEGEQEQEVQHVAPNYQANEVPSDSKPQVGRPLSGAHSRVDNVYVFLVMHFLFRNTSYPPASSSKNTILLAPGLFMTFIEKGNGRPVTPNAAVFPFLKCLLI